MNPKKMAEAELVDVARTMADDVFNGRNVNAAVLAYYRACEAELRKRWGIEAMGFTAFRTFLRTLERCSPGSLILWDQTGEADGYWFCWGNLGDGPATFCTEQGLWSDGLGETIRGPVDAMEEEVTRA